MISLSVQIVIIMYGIIDFSVFCFQSKDVSLIPKFSVIYDINIIFFLQNASEKKMFSDAEEEIPLQKGQE